MAGLGHRSRAGRLPASAVAHAVPGSGSSRHVRLLALGAAGREGGPHTALPAGAAPVGWVRAGDELAPLASAQQAAVEGFVVHASPIATQPSSPRVAGLKLQHVPCCEPRGLSPHRRHPGVGGTGSPAVCSREGSTGRQRRCKSCLPAAFLKGAPSTPVEHLMHRPKKKQTRKDMLCEICHLCIAVNRETGGAECTRPGRTKNCWRESQIGRDVQQEVHYDIMSLIRQRQELILGLLCLRADSNQLGLACNCHPLRTFPPLTLYKELCHVITGLSRKQPCAVGLLCGSPDQEL